MQALQVGPPGDAKAAAGRKGWSKLAFLAPSAPRESRFQNTDGLKYQGLEICSSIPTPV